MFKKRQQPSRPASAPSESLAATLKVSISAFAAGDFQRVSPTRSAELTRISEIAMRKFHEDCRKREPA